MRVNLVLSLIFSITAGGSPVRVALSVLPSLSFPGVSVQEDSCTGSLGDDFGGNQGGWKSLGSPSVFTGAKSLRSL